MSKIHEIELHGDRYQVKVPASPRVSGPKFRSWFGDSKIVDSDGSPLLVYHGSAREDKAFRPDRGYGMGGVYFTPDLDEAMDFAINDQVDEEDSPFVSFVYLAMRNPRIFTQGIESQEFSLEQKAKWEAQGYDGVLRLNAGLIVEVAAFRLDQLHIVGQPAVKSVERALVLPAGITEQDEHEERGVGR